MTKGSPTPVFVAGDITFNSLIYLNEFPEPRPQTVFSTGFNETIGGTAAGKALNLNRLGLDVTLHGLIGDDVPSQKIREAFARENLTLIADCDPRGRQRHVNLMEQGGGRISIYVHYVYANKCVAGFRLTAYLPHAVHQYPFGSVPGRDAHQPCAQ